jgi:hypothetical protein
MLLQYKTSVPTGTLIATSTTDAETLSIPIAQSHNWPQNLVNWLNRTGIAISCISLVKQPGVSSKPNRSFK